MAHDNNNVWLEMYQQHIKLQLQQHNAMHRYNFESWDGYQEVPTIKHSPNLWNQPFSTFVLYALIEYHQAHTIIEQLQIE